MRVHLHPREQRGIDEERFEQVKLQRAQFVMFFSTELNQHEQHSLWDQTGNQSVNKLFTSRCEVEHAVVLEVFL